MKESGQNDLALQQLTDQLMRYVLDYKATRDSRYLADITNVSTRLHALGYHPTFHSDNDALVVSKMTAAPSA